MKARGRGLAGALTVILLLAAFSSPVNASSHLSVTASGVHGGLLSGSWQRDPRGHRQVPEPGTLALLAIGLIGTGMGMALSRRRSQRK